jgi:putative ABC transport system permease protein
VPRCVFALRSSPGAIAALVLRQGVIWMAAGLAAGAVGVVLITRMLRDLLYGVAPLDPLALGTALVALLACAALALAAPVRRATRGGPRHRAAGPVAPAGCSALRQ